MHESAIEEQLRLIQQELTSTGETLETLRRDQRAEVDALRLDIEALRRCLILLHPDFAARFDALRAQVVRDTDPEAS